MAMVNPALRQRSPARATAGPGKGLWQWLLARLGSVGAHDPRRLNDHQLRDIALTRDRLERAGVRTDCWPFGI